MSRSKAFDQNRAQAHAMRLFWQKGYAATSVENLVETLQISRSSLYDTFGDKRKLFLTVLRQYSELVIMRMDALMSQSPSPITAIHVMFDDLTASSGTLQGEQGCFMVNSVAELVPFDKDVTQIASAYAQKIQHIIAQALIRAQADGLITLSTPPEQLAAYLFNTTLGMRLLAKAGTTREQLQAITDITLKALA